MSDDLGVSSNADDDEGLRPWADQTSIRSSVSSGALWTAIGNGIVFAVWLPVTALQVRLMSRDAYGEYAVAFSACLLLTPVVGFGLNAAVARWYALAAAEHGRDGVAAVVRLSIYITKWATVVALVGGLIMLGVMELVHTLRPDVPSFAILLPVLVTAPMTQLGNGLIQGSFRPRVGFVSNAVTSALLLSLTAALLLAGEKSSESMAVARTFAVVAGVLVLSAGSRWRSLSRVPTTTTIDARRFVTFGAAIAFWAILGMTLSQLDVLFLGAFKGSSAAGAYVPVSRIADLVMALVAVVGTYLPPAIAGALSRGEIDLVARTYYWASRWALAVSAPAIGMLVVTPATLLNLLFGGNAVLVTPARILGAAVWFDVLFGFNGSVMASSGATTALATVAGVGLGVNVVICLVAIPLLGATGAAIATAVPLLVVNVYISVKIAKSLGIVPWNRQTVLCVLSPIAGGVVAALILRFTSLPALARLVVAGGLAGLPALALAAGGHGSWPKVIGRLRFINAVTLRGDDATGHLGSE